jgi:hypothetical protein
MDRSVLLAKLIGPLFLAAGLGVLLNQGTYWGVIDEVIRHPSPIGNLLIYLSGLLSMLGGLAVVNAHPSWTRDLAGSNHHHRLATARGRHRAHGLTGHYAETWFNALRIADSATNRRCHLARARWLSKLQGILDGDLSTFRLSAP